MDIFNYSRYVLVNRSPFYKMFCSCLRFIVELMMIVETSLSETNNFLKLLFGRAFCIGNGFRIGIGFSFGIGLSFGIGSPSASRLASTLSFASTSSFTLVLRFGSTSPFKSRFARKAFNVSTTLQQLTNTYRADFSQSLLISICS